MMSLFDEILSLSGISKKEFEKMLEQNNKKYCYNSENSNFEDCLNPGNIVNLEIDKKLVHGIVLANKALILIDPDSHTVKGYLSNFTDTIPYNIWEIKEPNATYYKYTDPNVPVVWTKKPEYVDMSISEIEKQLGIVPGKLKIRYE